MQDKFEQLLLIAAVVLLVGCTDHEVHTEHSEQEQPMHWGYEADDGPDQWSSMNTDWALCADGRQQSPIDLTAATDFELPPAIFNRPTDQELEVVNQAGVINALDNGHTIQVNSKTGETMSVGDKSFALVQFHFHAPSEHTVDGQHYPMEIHFVHQAEDGALAVVGILVEEGEENPFAVPLWEQLAQATGTATTVYVAPEFDDHFEDNAPTSLYHYMGSLTTPPCSEGVNWYVRERPAQFSREQIAAFTAVYDHNNRPVQALNNRTLYLDDDPEVVIH